MSTTMESSSGQHVTCPRLRDFEFGNLLGQGAFARVMHVRDVCTDEEYALKVISKRQTQVRDRKSSVIVERNLLMSLDHPGIVRLHWTLQDDWSLYFVLEFCEGGELAAQIARMGACSLEFAQFYAAEIVVILEYLQARHVAHRDLKPENLLLTLSGHLKLIDFDAAIIVPDEGEGDAAGGCCQGQPACAGTVWYLPPEVINSTAKLREAYALDLWALGCIIYQMLVGSTPFAANAECLVFEKIQRGEYSFPRAFPHRAARELVEVLLTPEPSARPGQGAEGMADLKRRNFFGGSMAAFNELLCRRPPQRVQRRRGVASMPGHSIASNSDASESPGHSFDFTSSAECTPEIGQNFLARMTTQIHVSDARVRDSTSLEGETHLDRGAPRLTENTGTASKFRDLEASWEASPKFMLSIQQSAPDTSSSRSTPQSSPSRRHNSYPSSPPQLSRGPNHMDAPLVARPSNQRLEAILASALGQSGDSRCWIRPDLPVPEWKRWLRQLTVQQMLNHDEGVIICGSVVRRKLSCLQPKVLMLTDQPRLLLLDSSGLRLLRQFDLAGSVSQDGVVVSCWSPFDFELRTPHKKYECYDINVGAEEWTKKINLARDKAFSQR